MFKSSNSPMTAYNKSLTTILAIASMLSTDVRASPTVSFYTGSEFQSGDYGYDETTEILTIPLGLSVTQERLTLFVESAFIRADGYQDAIAQTTTNNTSHLRSRWQDRRRDTTAEETVTVSGLGDTIFGTGIRLTPNGQSYYLGTTLTTSAPTGSEDDGLGYGEWVSYLSLDGEKRWGAIAVTSSVGYAFAGDIEDFDNTGDGNPESIDGDYSFASFGTYMDTNDHLTLGTRVDWTESIFEDRDVQATLKLTASWRLDNGFYLSSSLAKGLTDSSQDLGASVTLSFTPSNGH